MRNTLLSLLLIFGLSNFVFSKHFDHQVNKTFTISKDGSLAYNHTVVKALSNSAMFVENHNATVRTRETRIPSNINFGIVGLQYNESIIATNDFSRTLADAGINNLEDDEFITTWQTDSDNESITIPTTGTGYNYTVDWGDGTTDNNVAGNISHTYTSAGTHTVKITGDFPRIYFNHASYSYKIKSVDNWGAIQWESMEGAFRGCSFLSVLASDAPNLTNVTVLDYMFVNCNSLTAPDLSNWDLSNVVQVNSMFSGSANFNGNITTWDVGSITNFQDMFLNAQAFNQDINGWNIGERTTGNINMTSMFRNASSFDQDLGDWDISNVNNMRWMLDNSRVSVANYDATLIGWATLDIEETQIPPNIYLGAAGLNYCISETQRTLLTTTHNWTLADAGLHCTEEDKFTTTWETTSDNESITIPTTGTGYDYTVDWGDGTTDSDVIGNISHTYTLAGTHTVKITGNFPRIYFNHAAFSYKIKSVDNWGTIQWASMEGAFRGCSFLSVLASDAPNLTNVTVLDYMFVNCNSLTTPDLSNWDLSNVVQVNSMFAGSMNFNGNITTWDVGSITNFQDMFLNAQAFNQDINGWNIGERTTENINMTSMFRNAYSFDQDLGDWDISSVNGVRWMFNNSGVSVANYDATLIGWATLDTGETQIPSNIYLGATGLNYCLSETERDLLTSATYNWTIIDEGKLCEAYIEAKVFLQGAALNPNAGEETLMRDDLRIANLLSTTSPYADGLTCNASVFNTIGQEAIVDWVWVELRDKSDNRNVLYSTSALLQRDGDIVTVDGISPIAFAAETDDYFIVIKHRNHLGIMSLGIIALNVTGTTVVDFSDANNQITFGSNAQTTSGMQSGIVAMWAGNVNGDSIIQYSGTNPDLPTILSTVLNAPSNFLYFPTFEITGYSTNDVNMDGNTQYSGINPDTPFLLQNVLEHSGNFLNFSTYQIIEQLPEN